MPTLQFKGKNIIWNHHLSVPYHTLEEVSKLHFQPDKSNGNLIIEGDNLLALKALLPMFAGKVKVVCIDPPYNTGNEGWVYNDNANSPLIKDWLGKEVGKDDLTRHDKWLCMMTPRLKLLRELLADDGVIFVNIDDNEVHHLRMVMDEVFGEQNFIAIFTWKRRASSALAQNLVSQDHEYVVCYGKMSFQGFIGNPKDYSAYTNRDNDPKGDWTLGDLTVGMTREQRPNQYYDLVDPKTGRKFKPSPQRIWAFIPERMDIEIQAGHVVFPDNIDERPMFKRYKRNLKSSVNPISTWIKEVSDKKKNDIFEIESGLNSESTKLIQEIFGHKVFDYPKPLSLIKNLIRQVTESNSIALDSFSGSGTTGHAVMDLNKEDGGSRKFILVQMNEANEKEPNKNICKDITRERIKRAIEKYDYDSGFQYLRVGQPLDAETLLKGKLPDYKSFAKYVYYLCTGENLKEDVIPAKPVPEGRNRGAGIQKKKKLDSRLHGNDTANKTTINESTFFVSTFGKHAIYLIYKQDFEALTRMALNLEMAEKIIADQPDKKRIVYAPACFLDEEYMEANQIEFVSIPYNLFQRKG